MLTALCRKNPDGYKKWSKKLSNSRPKLWNYLKEKSKKWTLGEIERVLDAISVLPNILTDLDKIKLYRMLKSQSLKNPATINSPQGDLVLYDLAFNHKNSLAQIIAHELSHILFENLNEREKREFADKADWERIVVSNRVYYFSRRNKKYIESDSKASSEEDFANHVEMYLFNSNHVKTKSLPAYNWIKNKYGKDFKVKEGL